MDLIEKYVNPLTDFGFKRLFGSEPNKDLVIDFLNQLLPEKHRIVELSYAPSEKLGGIKIERGAIFDLYCVSGNGDRFIVEVQKAKQNFFKERSVFYSTFPIRDQAEQGDWRFKLSAVYTVGILDFVFDDHVDDPEFLHEVKLKDQDCNVFYDKLTYIYIELPKFQKSESELVSRFDKWLYVLRHLPDLEGRPVALQERVFERLFEAAAIANFNKEEERAYEQSLKHYRDLFNVVETAREEGEERGLEKGLEKGLKKGLEKGLKKGLEKGWKLRGIDMARKLKAAGVDLDTIVEASGLGREEIEAL